MKITPKHLKQAVAQDIISDKQASALYAFLASRPDTGPSFSMTNVLYYFGGLIAIGAMTVFMNLGWETFGGWGILACSVIYAVAGLLLSRHFDAKGLTIPAGICATFVIILTPLAVYGLQQALGVWPDDEVYRDYHRHIAWHWLYMELATLVVGVILAWRYRYPFMLMPVAVTLWYLSMDVAVMLAGSTFYNFEFRAFISMYCGLVTTLVALWVDIRGRSKADYAFWLYLFGVATFWCGLTAQDSDSELARLGYFCVNLLMIAAGVILTRRVFVVFGAIGSCIYLGHLAHDVFKDSWFFPVALTFIGLAIIFAGLQWQKHEQMMTQWLRAKLPRAVADFLDTHVP